MVRKLKIKKKLQNNIEEKQWDRDRTRLPQDVIEEDSNTASEETQSDSNYPVDNYILNVLNKRNKQNSLSSETISEKLKNFWKTPEQVQENELQKINEMNDNLSNFWKYENNNQSQENNVVSDDNIAENTDNNYSSAWKMYQNQLKQNTANYKAELSAINDRTNSFVNTYLKQLGLSGTAEGVNQITSNAFNLANAYSDLNRQEQQALDEQRQVNSDRLSGIYQTAVNSGASAREINELIDKYDDDSLTPGTKEILKDYAKAEGITWNSDRQYIIDSLKNSKYDDDAEKLIDILNNAKTEQEFYDLYDKFEEFINDPSKIGKKGKNLPIE